MSTKWLTDLRPLGLLLLLCMTSCGLRSCSVEEDTKKAVQEFSLIKNDEESVPRLAKALARYRHGNGVFTLEYLAAGMASALRSPYPFYRVYNKGGESAEIVLRVITDGAAAQYTLEGKIPTEWRAQHTLLKQRLKDAGVEGDANIDDFVNRYDVER